MAEIVPFRAVRPVLGKAAQFSTPSVDLFTEETALQHIKLFPESFLNIVKPHLREPALKKKKLNDRLRHSQINYQEWQQKGILLQDEVPCYYLYRQTSQGYTHSGIMAAIRSEHYFDGTIRIHEQTISSREQKLKDYLAVVGINAEPVMFTYPRHRGIDEWMHQAMQAPPLEQFEMQGHKHELWVIGDAAEVHLLHEYFKSLTHVYVADGHHRSASSALLSRDWISKTGHKHPSQYFMGIFFPQQSVRLLAFNRWVKDLNGFKPLELLNAMAETFEVQAVSGNSYQVNAPHHFGFYCNNQWYALRLKSERLVNTRHEKLDTQLLNNEILSPIFGIKDPRKDNRLAYVSSKMGLDLLMEKVNDGTYAAAFTLFPVSFEQFFEWADNGLTMPPKSTWFEPKLLNGLVIYDLHLHNPW